MNTTETLEEARIKSRLAEAKSLQQQYQNGYHQGMVNIKLFPRTKLEFREEYVCNKYFGGMPLDTAIAILKEHAPEYFV